MNAKVNTTAIRITNSYEIADDILRDYPVDEPANFRFRPAGVDVSVDLRTGHTSVGVHGPTLGPGGTPNANSWTGGMVVHLNDWTDRSEYDLVNELIDETMSYVDTRAL